MSSIVTFYSYKGGVGRSMALANIAVLLAQRGMKVLMVDWDLEAPGLGRDEAFELMRLAHETCPYSRATRGNIEVMLTVGGTSLERQAA